MDILKGQSEVKEPLSQSNKKNEICEEKFRSKVGL
jgi:hypothetical protein